MSCIPIRPPSIDAMPCLLCLSPEQAQLRLPTSLSKADKNARVNSVLADVGLIDCAEVKIGECVCGAGDRSTVSPAPHAVSCAGRMSAKSCMGPDTCRAKFGKGSEGCGTCNLGKEGSKHGLWR